MPYVEALDPLVPGGGDPIADGDDSIRQLKRAVNERMARIIDGWPDIDPPRIIVAEDVDALPIAWFRNLSATGLGLVVQTAGDELTGLPSFKARNSISEDVVQFLPSGMAQFGDNAVALAAWQAWRPNSPYVISAAKSGVATGDAGFVWIANATIDGFETFSCIANAAGNDQGWRFQYNSRPEQGAPNGTHNRPDLYQSWFGYEDDGSWSIVYFKPVTVVAGAWDGLAGKSFRVMAGGGGGATGEFVQVFVGQVARGMEIGVVDAGGTPNIMNPKIRIKGDAGTDPISIYVDGAMKNVTQGVDDSAGAGKAVLCVPN